MKRGSGSSRKLNFSALPGLSSAVVITTRYDGQGMSASSGNAGRTCFSPVSAIMNQWDQWDKFCYRFNRRH
jgi:hypothetical protein